MINRHEQGYYWHGVFHRGPIPGALQTPDESDHDEPRQGKKARGRPRNEQKAAVVRNVPRGSPLPSKRELATKTNGRDEAFELSDSEEDLDTTAIAQPIKRKRGRPRKYGANGLILMSPEVSPIFKYTTFLLSRMFFILTGDSTSHPPKCRSGDAL